MIVIFQKLKTGSVLLIEQVMSSKNNKGYIVSAQTATNVFSYVENEQIPYAIINTEAEVESFKYFRKLTLERQLLMTLPIIIEIIIEFILSFILAQNKFIYIVTTILCACVIYGVSLLIQHRKSKYKIINKFTNTSVVIQEIIYSDRIINSQMTKSINLFVIISYSFCSLVSIIVSLFIGRLPVGMLFIVVLLFTTEYINTYRNHYKCIPNKIVYLEG